MKSIVKVLIPAASFDLTVLATVKSQLGITGTADDTRIAFWIRGASDAFASATKRVLAKEKVRQTFYLDREEDSLVLARYPVTGTLVVKVDGVVVADTTYSVEADTGLFYCISDSGALCNWSSGTVEIEYSGGYQMLTDLPYDIENAVITMVNHARSASNRDPMAKRIEIPDVETVDYWVGSIGQQGSGMIPEVQAVIDKYKAVLV